MKETFRKLFASKRAAIPTERRSEAAEKLLLELTSFLKDKNHILSFASMPLEANLWPLNQKLAEEKRLYLPRVDNQELKIYKVENLQSDLQLSRWNILEPAPDKCAEASLEAIDCVLVPGLGFDRFLKRLGYGKGHYDRLLNKMGCVKIGIGLKEQFFEGVIPVEEHDQKLDHLILL